MCGCDDYVSLLAWYDSYVCALCVACSWLIMFRYRVRRCYVCVMVIRGSVRLISLQWYSCSASCPSFSFSDVFSAWLLCGLDIVMVRVLITVRRVESSPCSSAFVFLVVIVCGVL